MATWARSGEQRTNQSRTRTEETVNIGDNCAGLLTRIVTTYERGFAGCEEVGRQSDFSFRSDAAGPVSGELNTQLLVQEQNRVLLLGEYIHPPQLVNRIGGSG